METHMQCLTNFLRHILTSFIKQYKFISIISPLRTWYPQLACIGIDGIPSTEEAGNVMRVETVLKISIRLPPTLDSKKALEGMKNVIFFRKNRE